MKNINSLKIILQGVEFPGVTFIKHAKNEFRNINSRFERKVAAIDEFVKRGYNTVNKL